MFCSTFHNVSSESELRGFFVTDINNSCVVEFVNIACFACYIYVLILLLICVNWLPNTDPRIATKKILFYCHNIRHILIVFSLMAHLIEFADQTITKSPIWPTKSSTAITFLSIIVCQLFYNKLESYNKRRYLAFTAVYWTCYTFCKISLFFIDDDVNGNELDFTYVRYSISFVVIIVGLSLTIIDILSLTKQKRQRSSIDVKEGEFDENMCSYKHPFCSWFTRITFYWLTPLLQAASLQTSLGPAHFGRLPLQETSRLHFEKLRNTFQKLKAKNDGEANLWSCFAVCYWKTFIFGGMLKLFGDFVGFVPPLGISIVVDYLESTRDRSLRTTQTKKTWTKWQDFIENGYVMSSMVFISLLMQGTLSQNSTHIINVEGIRLKNALQGLIYEKLLKVRKKTTNGKNNDNNSSYISTLAAEDTYNIMSCFWIANYIWAIPLKITILICLLYTQLGISSVIGSVSCIAFMLLLQFIIGKKMSQNYELISEYSDKRLRRMNEILQGIRMIKLSAMEDDFINDVSKLRNEELKRLDYDSLYWTYITFLANTSSIIIAMITLTLRSYIEDESLSLGSLFTSLALFNQLTVPLFIFPVVLPIVASAIVSKKRIENFLTLPEIEYTESKQTKNTNKVSFASNKGRNSSIKTDRLRKITENNETVDEETKNKVASPKPLSISREKSSSLVLIENLICLLDDVSKLYLQVEKLIFKAGSLNIIVGQKGSGKTSLIRALLGELHRHSGDIRWNRFVKIGYVPQTPWLLNDTLKANITFGRCFYEKQFFRVIQQCALTNDLNSMSKKEYTLIGDCGVTLSSGQKQRIMIARMLYTKPEMMIMDDTFSSLDSKVVQHIFDNGLRKFITKENRTVILTTNCKKFLSHADQVIVMENCRLKVAGSFSKIQSVASKDIQGLDEHTIEFKTQSDTRKNRSESNISYFVPLRIRKNTTSGSCYFTHELVLPIDDCDVASLGTLIRKQKRCRAATVTSYPRSPAHHRNVFRVSSLQTNQNRNQYFEMTSHYALMDDLFEAADSRESMAFDLDTTDKINESNELTDANRTDETDFENATAQFASYFAYVKSCGAAIVILYVALTFAWQILRISTDFWISYAISSTNENHTENKEIRWYLYTYVILSCVAIVLSLCSTAVGQYAGSIGRKNLHKNLLINLLKCTVQFFDNTLFAQIMNRFSTDIEAIDKKISTSIQRLIQFQLLCVSAILINCIVTPWFVIIVIPIVLIYYMVQRYYQCSSRELQRLENVFKTPISNHFTETFEGLETIRATNRESTFTKILFEKIDLHNNVFLILNSTNRWLGVMLDYLGGIIVFAAMLVSLISVAVNPRLKLSASFGLAINYTLLLPVYLTWVVKFLNDLEIYINGVNRIRNYTKASIENYRDTTVVPENWPKRGEISFKNVTIRYKRGCSVVENFNLYINDGQKVGICGRTGSGKSSIVMSLFKIAPLVEGEIRIDGIDINNVPLRQLRSKISIVSQDMLLFGGNIRQNLDIRGEYSDEQLWNVLKLVKIDEIIANMGGLNANVQDGGSNVSCGEKQLICLARAILKDSSCLILDEATNSLQPETEIGLFESILNIFQNRTVLVITHRVSSLLNFDRVLVINNGTLIEDGPPEKLISNKNGQFYSYFKTSRTLQNDNKV